MLHIGVGYTWGERGEVEKEEEKRGGRRLSLLVNLSQIRRRRRRRRGRSLPLQWRRV